MVTHLQLYLLRSGRQHSTQPTKHSAMWPCRNPAIGIPCGEQGSRVVESSRYRRFDLRLVDSFGGSWIAILDLACISLQRCFAKGLPSVSDGLDGKCGILSGRWYEGRRILPNKEGVGLTIPAWGGCRRIVDTTSLGFLNGEYSRSRSKSDIPTEEESLQT